MRKHICVRVELGEGQHVVAELQRYGVRCVLGAFVVQIRERQIRHICTLSRVPLTELCRLHSRQKRQVAN